MKTKQQSYPKLAEALGVSEIYFKREDQHKYSSHKGRSIPLMIKEYHKQGWNDFVISSSGNAALAAILAISSNNRNKPNDLLTLKVFVGSNIEPNKLVTLNSELRTPNFISIEQVERPKQSAFQLDKAGTHKLLRQSTDDTALLGYYELAEELNKISNLQAIFIPTSSGTTAQAIGEAFEKLEEKPQIHIVQTQFCHPIAEVFDKLEPGITRRNNSVARAIVDKIAHRKEKIVGIIKNSHGSGWIVSDEEIKDVIKLVKKTTNIEISPNSALSIAGLKKAVENGWKFENPVVCLITGQ